MADTTAQPLRPPSADEAARRPMCAMNVGDRWRSRARTIAEADVVNFGCLTGDMHPQHMDAVYAASSPFGRRIAHGMLVVSFAMGLVPTDYAVALRKLKNVVFKDPVFFGDTICVEGTVLELRPMTDDLGV